MADVLALSGTGVRAVLIGTARHVDGSRLAEVPEVVPTLRMLAKVLVERCGLAEDRLRVVCDPEGPEDMLDAVIAAADEADDVLLLYYVGHGLLSMSGELHLATRATRDLTLGKAAYQALPYAEVRNAVLRSRAESVVILLDCCFSGRAELPQGRSAVLTSASGEQTALIPPGAEHPAFTGELLSLLTEGDPDGPPFLSIDHVDRYLKRTLRSRGWPLPRMQDRERARDLVLARNTAYRPPPQWEAEEPEPSGPAEDVCPYQGLAAYRTDDARFFRGRNGLVSELVGRLAGVAWTGGLVAVVGPSGSGKSSLLSAGLLPAIARGELGIPGSTGWRRVSITPGAAPLHTLAEVLLGKSTVDQSDPAAVRRRAAELLTDPHAARLPGRTVLVVDQFEELFTQCRDERTRQAFVTALDAVTRCDEGAVVVLGIRGDFYGHCLDLPQLKAVLADRQLLVGAMTTGELREAIEEPARITGRVLEPGLVELLLRDLGCDPADDAATGYEAGSLPLLSHTLLEVWRRRRGRVLSVDGYRDTGGIGQALARTADAVLAGMSESARDAARRILPKLVTVTDGMPDTLRRASRIELLAGLPDPLAGEQALQLLADARLVSAGTGAVTLTHETLIQSWPALRAWIDADRDWLRATQELTADARSWAVEHRESARLYRGAVLAGMMQRADVERRRTELEPTAQAFLDAAIQQERATARRRRVIMAVLATITVLALGSAGVAVWQQRVADRERRDADAQRTVAQAQALAAKAATLKQTQPALARQLTVAAYRIAPHDPQVDSAVLNAADMPRVATAGQRPFRATGRYTADGKAIVIGHDRGLDLRDGATLDLLGHQDIVQDTDQYKIKLGVVTDVALGHGDRIAALAGQSGLSLWDVSDRRNPKPLILRPVPNLRTARVPVQHSVVAMQPAGNLLAYSENTGQVQLLDTTNPQAPVLAGQLPYPGGNLGAIGFSPDGTVLAVHNYQADGGTRGTVTLWDVTNPASPTTMAVLPDAESAMLNSRPQPALAFGSDNLLAFAGAGNTVRLWDVSNRRKPSPLGVISGHTSGVTALAFSPDHTLLASGSEDDPLLITDVSAPNAPAVLGTIPAHTRTITGISFPPGGHRLATLSQDGSLRLWAFDDPRRRPALASITGKPATGELAANADRTLLATTGGGKATLWDNHDPARPTALGSVDIDSDVASAALSHDGHLLAITMSGNDPAVILIDVTNPRSPRVAGRIDTLSPLADGTPATPSVSAISGDSRLLAVGDMVGQIHIYDISQPATPTQRSVTNRTGPGSSDRLGWIVGLSFDPTRPLLAVASWLSITGIFDLSDPASPVAIAHTEKHREEVINIRFSPDGHWVASTDRIGTVLLWDLRAVPRPGADFSPRAELKVPSGDIPVVDFSPDGRQLAQAISNRTVRIWDLNPPTGPTQTLVVEPGGGSDPKDMLFGPNGDTVLIALPDSAIDTLTVSPESMAHDLCIGSGDPIDQQQWQQYLPTRPYTPPC